jgi:hypothetical protein
VESAVVPVAQTHHVVEVGVPAIDPMSDVMAMEMCATVATGKLAVTIPVPQGSLERAVRSAASSTDIDHRAFGGFGDPNGCRFARDPPDGFA